MEFRWNKIPELGRGRRPLGYRLEQKWIHDECSPNSIAEWKPIPFAEETMEAVPELVKEDMQFWPVMF